MYNKKSPLSVLEIKIHLRIPPTVDCQEGSSVAASRTQSHVIDFAHRNRKDCTSLIASKLDRWQTCRVGETDSPHAPHGVVSTMILCEPRPVVSSCRDQPSPAVEELQQAILTELRLLTAGGRRTSRMQGWSDRMRDVPAPKDSVEASLESSIVFSSKHHNGH